MADAFKISGVAKTSSERKIKEFGDKIKLAEKESGKNRKIVMIDPITFSPIKSRLSNPSNGEYKKINNIKLEDLALPGLNVKKLSAELKKIPKLFEKKSQASRQKKKKELKPCKEGKMRNPKTNRCVNKIKNKI